MKHKARIFWMAAGLALASTVSVAQAAKLTPEERAALVERAKQNAKKSVQPRTMKEAEATKRTLPNGTVAIAVPTELWNHVVASTDAQGQLTIHETDGKTAPVTTGGPTNE